MAAGPEALLVAKIKKAILATFPEAFLWKTHGSQYSVGMPDLCMVIRGVFIAMEVKAPRENESDASVMARVTPLQIETMKKMREAGGNAEAVWSVDQALDLLKRCVPLGATREDISRDARLYALQDHEDKLRKQLEEAETRIHELTTENNRFRSTT